MASPPGPSLGSGEEVIFSGHAVHKKILGTVWFTSRKAVWLATDAKAAVQRVELTWAAVKSFQCSPASEPRAMLRLLRVAEGEPPVILRFTETPADTPRAVLERAQAAAKKALRGDVEAGAAGAGAGAAAGGSGSGAGADGKGKGKGKMKGGQDAGAAKKMKWKTRTGLMGTASGGQSLRYSGRSDSMPGGRMRDVHDARQRAALLAGDDVLTAQYREMVDGGVVTEEEFWESRRRTLAEEEAKASSRRVGTPSDMPSDLVAETTSAGTLKFKLNARTIHSIFTMYPIVFKAYQANVPTEMSEKEFWTKYIQSAYFNRDRGGDAADGGPGGGGTGTGSAKRKNAPSSDGGAADDMFLRFAAQEAEREKAEKEKNDGSGGWGGRGGGRGGLGNGMGGARLEAGSVDPMVDLTSQWGDYHTREVDDSDPVEERTEAANKRKQVVGKFNRHARLVMQPPDGDGGARRPALVDTAASATDMPELRLKEQPQPEKLEIANRGRYGTGAGGGAALRNAINGGNTAPGRRSNGGGIGAGSRTRSPSSRRAGSVTLAEAKEQLGPDFVILGERPVLSRAVAGCDQAMAALRECTRETDKGIGNPFSRNEYPEDFMGSMHRHFQIVGELLRHSYSRLDRPKADTGAAAKLVQLHSRMMTKYEELRQLRAELPRNATGTRLSAVINPLMACLDHAFERFDERQSRGSRGGGGGVHRPGPNKGGWVVAGDDDDDDDDDDDLRGGWSVVKS